MIALLPSLLSEYCDLSQKLQQISGLILIYGGSLPTLPLNSLSNETTTMEIPVVPPTKPSTGSTESILEQYPLLGSWRTKLLYGMRNIGSPYTTAKELAGLILSLEKSDDAEYINRTVGQYLSTLGKSGTINVDKSEFPHKYSLK